MTINLQENDGRKGYRTAARTHIMEYLQQNSDRSVTAADISVYLENSGLAINLSTIYRYLGKLAEEGLVNKYTSESGSTALYQIAALSGACDGHLHLKCVRCGRIYHLDCEFMDEITEHILKDHGFEIICKGSVLNGLCDHCRTAVGS